MLTSLTTLAGNHLLTCVSAKLDYKLPESLDSVCSLWNPQVQSDAGPICVYVCVSA